VLPPANVEIRFLPERENLLSVARQLMKGKRAYPLMGIAWQFLTRPEACQVQIRPLNMEQRQRLYQCPVCRAGATDREPMVEHMMRSHFEDYFDKQEVQGEPPAGKFVCVARCG